MKGLRWSLALMLMSGVVHAGVGVGPKIGTLGYGGDVTVGVRPWLNVRTGINWFLFDGTVDFDKSEVDAEIELLAFPLLLDFHPYAGGFRISTGLFFNQSDVRMSAGEGKVLDLNGELYILENLRGSIDFDQTAYYLGIGYGNAGSRTRGRVHFSCDFGVMYIGTMDAAARATANDPTVQAALDAALAAEVETLNDELKPFQFYPYIALGLSVVF